MSEKKRKKKSARRQRIALCMIVRDEEANLGRCLQSARGLVSEINIVDTGSADNTTQIAKRFGAKVREIAWADDFSHARNISLQMADAEWILALDADEVLSPDAIPRIRSAVRSQSIAGYLLPTRNYMNDSSVAHFVPNDRSFEPAQSCAGWVESRKVRLFKNRPGIQFEGELHEVIGPSIRRSGARTEFLDAVVHHFGYLESEQSLRAKTEKMARLAEAKCASQPDDYKAHYELGAILATLENLKGAEQSYCTSIALRNDFALAHYDLGVVLSRTGREEEAVERYKTAARLDPNNIDAINNLADSLQRLRRDDEAERVYRELLDKHPGYKRSWNNLGALLASKGRVEEAKEAFENALKIDSNFADARQNLDRLRRLGQQEVNHEIRQRKQRDLRPGVSLCMIVRNEEEHLPGMLGSVKNAVDEIIIVDTGSTDGTRAGAEGAGASVLDLEWRDDFGAARNFSLSKATREWVFIMDADEAFDPGDTARIRSLIRNATADGFSFETRNYSCDSSLEGWRPASGDNEMARSFPGWFPSEKVRLFRNSPDIRFEGAIHELVEPSILRAGGAIERTDIPIHHYGNDRALEKAGAYLSPATEKVRANPDGAQAHSELGAILHKLGRFDEAAEALATAAALAPEQAEHLVALGDSLRAAGKAAESESAYRKAVRVRPGFSAAHRGLGIALFKQGKLADSLSAFEKAVELSPHDAQSITNIGVINAQIGENDKAATFFRRSLEINPHNATAQNNLIVLSSPKSDSERKTDPARLGLFMIVKDEEENLKELLPSLSASFDEIVIVDTGSADGTINIAGKYTDRVFSFPWQDDFSAARNFALSKAEADWLLWLDADDRIAPEAIAAMREHLSDKRKAYLLRVMSGADGFGAGEFLQLRLFPNVDGIEWKGRVHEQILPSIEEKGLTVETLPQAAISHMGYEDANALIEKSRRNAGLLERERALRPDDPYVLQHLAQSYGVLGEIDKAVEASEALVNSQNPNTPAEFFTHTVNRLIQYGLIRNDIEAAGQWADRLLETAPNDRLVRYFLGEICYRKGLAKEAIEWYEQFLHDDEVIGCVPVPWKVLEANAHNYLGLLFERTDRRGRARSEFRSAIEKGARSEAHKNLSRMYLEENNPAEAELVLWIAVESKKDDAIVWTNLGVALARQGKFRQAVEASQKALELDPHNVLARENLQQLEEKLKSEPLQPKSFSLSVCIIVKDEADCLREAIRSVTPIADEILVIDTGSTDATIEIARECGATVKSYEWHDDFAAARNFSLDLAASDWILVIDADEVIDAQGLYKIAALDPDSDVWGYSITTRNYSADRQVLGWRPAVPSDEHAREMPGWLPSTKVRLFRNLPEIRFEGRLHECVEPSILRAGKKIKSLEVPVHHYGYIDKDTAKQTRYLDLAKLKAGENPADARAHYELGIQHMVAGDIDGAEKALSEAITLDPKNALALLNLGSVKIMLERFDDARRTLEEAIESNPGSAAAHYSLGIALEKLDQYEDAEKRYSEALALDPDDSNTLAKLGYLNARKDEMKAAENYLTRALELDSSNRSARNNLAFVRRKMSPASAASCDLSLNMIVKDEAENLRQGLAPIAELFDEIIIADTGSTDDTVAVAESLGARVISHPWNDSFGDARNAALKASKGKWIFWLDADDRIEPGAVATLRKFIARGIPCGVFFPVESCLNGDGSQVKNYSLRFFPNRADSAWTGAVHEQIAPSLRSGGVELVNCPDISIRHTGYEKDGDALKKNVRNLKLLAKDLSANPEDPYIMLALAQAFLFCGQTENAAKWLEVLWGLREQNNGAGSIDVFWMAAVMLSDCAVRCDNAADASAWLERAIEISSDNWLAYFLLGEKKLAEGDRAHALTLLKKATEIGVGPTLLPLNLAAIKDKLNRYILELEQVASL
jgi:glycosyltransferase involved in cell wall biosynthesis